MEGNSSDDSLSSFSSNSSTASNSDKFVLDLMPFKNEKGISCCKRRFCYI